MTFIDVLWACYLIPTVIAWLRYHRQALAITLINVFAGWTLIGWLAVLVWALRGPTNPPPVWWVPRSRRRDVSALVGALFVWGLLSIPALCVSLFLALAGGGTADTGSTRELFVISVSLFAVFGWPAAVIAVVKSTQRWKRGLDLLPSESFKSAPTADPRARFCPSCGQPIAGGRYCVACGARLSDSAERSPTGSLKGRSRILPRRWRRNAAVRGPGSHRGRNHPHRPPGFESDGEI